MKNIEVSVIIPVYNVPLEYLRACLDSLIVQTKKECEFIVVSDGAPEAECSICEEYVQKDSRFKFFKRKHAGVSAARNHGIKQAQGEYITFVDADDWIKKEMCQKAYDYAKKNDSDISFYDCFFYRNKKIIGETKFNNKSIPLLDAIQRKKYKKNVIHFQDITSSIPAIPFCKFYKKQFLDYNKFLFSEDLAFGEDRFFSLTTISKASKISYNSAKMYFMRKHSLSTTHRYTPHSLDLSLKYINKLKTLADEEFNYLIGQETLFEFYTAWNLDYMHPQNPKSFFSRMQALKKDALSPHFQELLKLASNKNLSFIMKIELYLLKHKITFFIWIHGLKHLLGVTKNER